MGTLTLLMLLLAAPAEWTKVATVDGIEVFSRDLPNQRFAELRLITTSSSTVESLCDAAYGTSTIAPGEPAIVARTLIRETRTDTGAERVTYEQVNPPAVSARDFGLRVKKQLLPSGVCRLSFDAANELAPAMPAGFVRIETLHGSWVFESAGTGTRTTYTVLTDPGGDIPALFVHGPLKTAAVDWVKFVVHRAQTSSAVLARRDP